MQAKQMPTIERRSGSDRRRVPRFSVKKDVEWEIKENRRKGSLSDISTQGCFVLSSGEVEDGERVKLFLPLSDGMKVEFEGEITNHAYEIGFAMRFDELSASQIEFIRKLIHAF